MKNIKILLKLCLFIGIVTTFANQIFSGNAPYIYYIQVNPKNITNNLVIYYKGNYFDINNGKSIITSIKPIDRLYLLFTNPNNLPKPILDNNKKTVVALEISNSKNYILYYIKNIDSKVEIIKEDIQSNPTIVPEDAIIIPVDPKFIEKIEQIKNNNSDSFCKNLIKIDFSDKLLQKDIDSAILAHADLKPFHSFNKIIR